MPTEPSVLITGASTGIGAVYERFAKRGRSLVLVARDRGRMETLADRLRRETGVAIDILRADLTQPGDLNSGGGSAPRRSSHRRSGQQRKRLSGWGIRRPEPESMVTKQC